MINKFPVEVNYKNCLQYLKQLEASGLDTAGVLFNAIRSIESLQKERDKLIKRTHEIQIEDSIRMRGLQSDAGFYKSLCQRLVETNEKLCNLLKEQDKSEAINTKYEQYTQGPKGALYWISYNLRRLFFRGYGQHSRVHNKI